MIVPDNRYGIICSLDVMDRASQIIYVDCTGGEGVVSLTHRPNVGSRSQTPVKWLISVLSWNVLLRLDVTTYNFCQLIARCQSRVVPQNVPHEMNIGALASTCGVMQALCLLSSPKYYSFQSIRR